MSPETQRSARLEALPAAGRICRSYERYLKSLVPITDQQIRKALFDQLNEGELVKGPFLEATPSYRRGRSPRELIAAGELPATFADLDCPELPLDRPLYLHQERALLRARAGRNLVVSTGTGSGKTESFLLPILAELSEQHARGSLGPGVRAILLYPMNALANDQVKRLRKTLAGVPHITFGRYTGETKEDPKDASALFANQFPHEDRLPNELLSRQEMRQRPPHLLLTNYAMLEYLLLRPQDLDLFDPSSDTWRFIVVDEAHVYDGARGTEVAMLLRRLRDRVRASRVQVIATSATVGSEADAERVIRFARNLFDVPFEWDQRDPDKTDIVRSSPVTPPQSTWTAGPEVSFAKIAAAPRAEVADPDLVEPRDPVDPWLAGLEEIPAPTPAVLTGEELIEQAAGSAATGSAARTLAAEDHIRQLRAALLEGPREVSQLAVDLFPGRDDPTAELAGLVDLAAGLRDEDGNPVISARYHLWANAADAAYVCLHEGEHHGFLRERATCDRCAAQGRDDVPVWQFAACQRCSTGYIQGRARDAGSQVRAWLALGHVESETDEDDEATVFASGGSARPQWLCPECGRLQGEPGGCPSCGGTVRAVTKVTSKATDDANVRRGPIPERCVACGGYTKGLIRGLSAGPEASTSVLATAIYQDLPGDQAELPGEGRKLLAFSDSRQQAAYFAPYMQSGYQKILWRRVLHEAVRGAYQRNDDKPAPFDDVLARAVTLANDYNVITGASGITARREVASWLIAELSGTDERNSLEGTGLIQISVDHGKAKVPPPLLALGLTPDEAWALVAELLKTVRRAGAMELPSDLDVALDHQAFGPRKPDWGFCASDPDPKRHIAAWSPQRGTNKRLSFIERVLLAKGVETHLAAELMSGLWRWLTRPGGPLVSFPNRAGRVSFNLGIDSVRLSPSGPQFRCDRCRRWAAGSVAGVCPTLNCSGQMQPAELPQPGRETDHYRYLYRFLAPSALTASEHTAQWTSREAAAIQEGFISGRVNLLSCSTTFELGVDVGELQSVMLRNVPPTTANYVQRAGRAGRRGTAAALVVTFARSRPHDQAMFRDPLGMIAGTMRAPYVPIDNERIARRHVHSIAFAAFFRHYYQTRGLTWQTVASFLSPEISPSGPDLLAEFLRDIPADVAASARRVVPETLHETLGLSSGTWARALVEQVTSLRAEYRSERKVLEDAKDAAIAQDELRRAATFGDTIKTLDNRRLLDRLATKNVLPKYGFPVDVVELKTYHLSGLGNKLELARDLAVAIAEYAPGGQIVAGGKVIRSAGLAMQPGKAWVRYKVGTCDGAEKHFVMRMDGQDFPNSCPECGARIKEASALHPEFGFVADRRSELIGDEPPRSTPVEAAKVLRLSSEPRSRRIATPRGIIDLTWGKRAEFAVVSTGRDGRGWWICNWCGRGIPVAGNPPNRHEHPMTGRECSGTLQHNRLVHTFETDAVAIHLPNLAFADREAVLAALLAGASDALEIPITDLGGTVHPTGANTQLVIYDTVPAGAGNAIRIASTFEFVVRQAMKRVEDCACGLDASCYACLRHYGNQRVHEELTREAAIRGLTGLTPSDGPPVGDDGMGGLPTSWREAIGWADPTLHDTLEVLAREGCPAPTIGLEVNDGQWQLEVAWEDARVAITTDSVDERDTWLRADGWTLVDAETIHQDLALQVVDALAGPDSSRVT